MRTTETEVTFRHSFSLSALEAPQPAGTYRVIMDEEEIGGLSFIAFRRTATMLHIPAIEMSAFSWHVVQIDPEELAAAIAADANPEFKEETPKGAQI